MAAFFERSDWLGGFKRSDRIARKEEGKQREDQGRETQEDEEDTWKAARGDPTRKPQHSW